MATKTTRARTAKPEMDTEFANRATDPFESTYMGVLRTNDQLLLERGHGSIAIYKDLKRDGKVFGALQKRQLGLVGFDWTVAPVRDSSKGDADALTMSDMLKEIAFDELCKQLLEATLVGFVPSEIIWTVRDGFVVPDRIVPRAQRRFVYVQDDPDASPQLRLLTRENMTTGVPVPDRKFIVHRVNAEDDNPYGNGLGLQTYWPVFFKRAGLVAWNKRLARTGSPIPWGKYPNNASPKDKATLMAALRAMSNDGVLMTPTGMDITLLESRIAAGSMSSERELAEYMDDWIAEVWLGQEPRGESGGAQAAAAKEREAVRLGLIKADSDLLSETLKTQLLDHIAFYNGLERCTVYRAVHEEADQKAMSETDKNVADLGFEPSEDQVRERYGDGWTRKVAPPPTAPVPGAPGAPGQLPTNPATFAEGDGADAQAAIDQAVGAVTDAEMQEALRGVFEPLLAAIEGAADFDDALAEAQAAFPRMDTAKLQALLANAMFGAQAYGRTVAG